MKPRLRKRGKWWICSCVKGGSVGKTPKEAYRNWFALMAQHG